MSQRTGHQIEAAGAPEPATPPRTRGDWDRSTSAPAASTEMVRPHDLRDGDRIVVAGQVLVVEVAPLPSFDGRSHRMVCVTDHGQLSWSLDAARWPCVERVASTSKAVA